jgi:3-oxoacyl-[acyl-carrier protein] reductase
VGIDSGVAVSNEFTDKTARVTGASRGIGAATAVALARAGVRRILIHGRFLEGAARTLERVREAGADGAVLPGDLETREGIQAFIETLPRGIDLLVNNAGSLVKRASLGELTDDLYDEVMNLNVKSACFITQAVVPSMKASGSGVIVNLSSIAARSGGGPGATVYAAAKAAVTTLTKGWAKELAPLGIRVNAVSPGTIDNRFHEQFSTRQVLDQVIAATPAGRLGTNEEVADVIVFLCSDAARYVHGQTIEINGGLLAP